MSKPYTDERLPGGLRTGQQYLDAIAKDGRRIFVDGEEVADVTAHPPSPRQREPWRPSSTSRAIPPTGI